MTTCQYNCYFYLTADTCTETYSCGTQSSLFCVSLAPFTVFFLEHIHSLRACQSLLSVSVLLVCAVSTRDPLSAAQLKSFHGSLLKVSCFYQAHRHTDAHKHTRRYALASQFHTHFCAARDVQGVIQKTNTALFRLRA